MSIPRVIVDKLTSYGFCEEDAHYLVGATQKEVRTPRAGGAKNKQLKYIHEMEPLASIPPGQGQIVNAPLTFKINRYGTATQRQYRYYKAPTGSTYLILDSLGKGNVGEVFYALKLWPHDAQGTCEFALKSISKKDGLIFSADFFQKTAQLEKQVAQEIYHIPQEEQLSNSSHHHLIIPLVTGTPLEKMPERQATLAFLKGTQAILRELRDTFHDKGFTHGDLKPNHIVLSNDFEKAQLIDFGHCAKASDVPIIRILGFEVKPLPMLYMQLAGAWNAAWNPRPATKAEDIAVLGIILAQKIHANPTLKEQPFLIDLVKEMQGVVHAKGQETQKDANYFINKIDIFLSGECKTQATAFCKAFVEADSLWDVSWNYSVEKLIGYVTCFPGREKYDLLKNMKVEIDKQVEKREQGEKSFFASLADSLWSLFDDTPYTRLERQKITLLKSAYDQLVWRDALNAQLSPQEKADLKNYSTGLVRWTPSTPAQRDLGEDSTSKHSACHSEFRKKSIK